MQKQNISTLGRSGCLLADASLQNSLPPAPAPLGHGKIPNCPRGPAPVALAGSTAHKGHGHERTIELLLLALGFVGDAGHELQSLPQLRHRFGPLISSCESERPSAAPIWATSRVGAKRSSRARS